MLKARYVGRLKVPKQRKGCGTRRDRCWRYHRGGCRYGRGILGVEERPRFRDYAVLEPRPSYVYREEMRIDTVLPEEGVTYYRSTG